MSRWVAVTVRWLREKSTSSEFPEDRIKRFVKKYVEESGDPYFKELVPDFISAIRTRKGDSFTASFSVGRNQTERMGLLCLLGRPEDAVLESERIMNAILAVFVEAAEKISEKTGESLSIATPSGEVIDSPDKLRERSDQTELIIGIYKKMKSELKSKTFRKRLEDEMKSTAALYFGDVYAISLSNFARSLSARYNDLEVEMYDEGFIPLLGVKVKFVEGREVPDEESAAELILRYLVKTAKEKSKADEELDAILAFWESKYGTEFTDNARRRAEKEFEANKKFLLECPEELKDYVNHILLDREGGVILGPGYTVIYSCTRNKVHPRLILSARRVEDLGDRSDRSIIVPVEELPRYGRFYDPPGLIEAYEKMKVYASCPMARPLLDVLEWAIKTRQEQEELVGEESESGLKRLRRLLS